MDVKQKLKKIRRLSLSEIHYRLMEQIEHYNERKNYKTILKSLEQGTYPMLDDSSGKWQELFESDQVVRLFEDPQFFRLPAEALNEEKRLAFEKDFSEEFQTSIQRANDFLQNKFSFLGVSFQLPDPIPWQSDPLSLKPFPGGFYRDIDIFTNQNPGDIKHVWEVNRLQFLVELAKAYFLTGEERFKNKLESVLLDWYQKNPYMTGVAWASALEVGVRAWALIWTLYFYLGAKEQNPEVLRTIVKLLYLSGEFLNRHLSIYFSPYNHLIGETSALFAIGFLFPGLRNASKWATRALKILDDQVEKQFYEDGGSVEQATFYHHFTLGFYLMCVSILKHHNQKVPPRIWSRVEKALEFAMYMMRPDGSLPYIGDIDDARSIYFTNPTRWDFRDYQCLGAVWFNRPDMKFRAGILREDAFWMMNGTEIELFRKMPSRTPDAASVALQRSGYFIFRSDYGKDAHYAFMDCGPLADGVYLDETPSAAHGHADLLSVEIAPFGKPFLIDPGFSNYRGEYNWHTYFRSTAAHNTVVIDEQSQAEQVGILKWRFAPDFKVLKVINSSWMDAVCGEHYGYRRLKGGPVHRRYFVFVEKTFWVVVDYLSDSGNVQHTVEWNWHFNEGIALVDASSDGLMVARNDGTCLKMLFKPLSEFDVVSQAFEGGKNPQDGWISPTYRARKPAEVLTLKAKTNFPLLALTLLLPENAHEEWEVKQASDHLLIDLKERGFRINFPQNLENEPFLIIEREPLTERIFLLKEAPFVEGRK